MRSAALGALARSGGIGPDELAAAMADAEGSVRRRACEETGRALARRASPETLVRLLLCALDDAEAAVAEMAAWALGEAGPDGAPAVERLSVMARHGPPMCREAAVAALGAIGDPTALPTVLAALEDRPPVRRRAALALAAFDDPAAEEGLRRAAADRDWQVRLAAEELLDDQ